MFISKRQAGMSMWSVMGLIAVIGTLFFQFLVLFSPIKNYMMMQTVLADIASDPDSLNASDAELRSKIIKLADFNDVRNFEGKSRQVVDFKDSREGKKIVINYSQKADFIEPVRFEVVLEDEILITGGR
ncbi:MAG: DUF4845 domain-containing protein [Pseudomonadota bacterium]